jgi:phosphonate transport system substrate-binding protein
LSTAAMLRAAGVDIERTRYRYTGSQSEVALGVIRGDFDAGGLKTSIGRKYAHLGLHLVADSAPLPGFVLVANARTVAADLRRRLGEALGALRPLERAADAALTHDWGKNVRYGAVAAADADFAGVRAALRGLQIPDRGNF